MRRLGLTVLMLLSVLTARGDDLLYAAGRVLGLTGTPGIDWSIGQGGGGWRLYGGGDLTLDDLRAITNRADVLALVAAEALAAITPVEVDRVAYTNGWSVRVLDDGTEVMWKHRNSPYDPAVDAAQEQAARDERRAVRDGFRAEIEDSKTNKASVVALSVEQAAGITNAQGLVFNASYNLAQVQELRNALVDDMRRQDKVIAELRRTNSELIDVIRLIRREMMDSAPEATTP
jgi:hypothetical protein